MFHPATSVSTDLLAEWRWLLGDRARFVGWSSSGDLFYADAKENVWRLDTGAGETECVASSLATFSAALQDPATARELLLLPVIEAFEAAHGPLAPTQCLGFTTLPVLGGAYTAENRYALSVMEHARVTGDIHRQVHGLPNGAQVRLVVGP